MHQKEKVYITGLQAKEIINSLNSSNNTLVYSIPGMGLNTITNAISEFYSESSDIYIINIYAHESYYDSYKDIEKLVLNKFRIDNKHKAKSIHDIPTLIEYLTENQFKLFVFLHKINNFEKLNKFMDFFNSLRMSSKKMVTVYADADILFSSNPIVANNFNSYCFKGYIDNFDEIIRQIGNENGIESLTMAYRQELFAYSLGHIGIIVTLIKSIKENNKLPTLIEITQMPEIKRRYNEITSTLKSLNCDLKDIAGNKHINLFDKIGISYNGKYMLVLQESLKKDFLLHSEIAGLTVTEENILRILTTHTDEYLNPDRIIFLLGPKYNDITEWTIYKHINNLSKKIKEYDISILSKRGVGYKISMK